MGIISYAQNYEDVLLWRALQNEKNGFYIDVGANDPEQDSVTKAFYDQGWSGINIEPMEQPFKRLTKQRTRDINLQLLAGAIEEEIPFFEIPDFSGLSTIDENMAVRHEMEHGCKKNITKVMMKKLATICVEHQVETVHFLKIDVEGAEKQVLQGFDFAKIRPWIVLVEATLPNTQIEVYQAWEPILISYGYQFVYFDGLNRFYVANEHQAIKDKFKLPPNYFDGFSLAPTQLHCQSAVHQMQQKINDIENQIAQAHSLIEEYQSQLQKIYNSKSWRITYPLRYLRRLLRKFNGDKSTSHI